MPNMHNKFLKDLSEREIMLAEEDFSTLGKGIKSIYEPIVLRINNALFLLNGGAVGLSITALGKKIEQPIITIFFVIGIIFALLMVSCDYFNALVLMMKHAKNINKFKNNEINCGDAFNPWSLFVRSLSYITIIFGFFSAFFFIVGCFKGFFVVLSIHTWKEFFFLLLK